MIIQLLLGFFVVSLTIVVEAIFIDLAIDFLNRYGLRFHYRGRDFRTILAIVGATVWMMFAHSLGVILWALCFSGVGVFDNFETSLYFSIVSFTTLGFGDVLLPFEWRLLSGISAANGLLIFGVSTAFLVEFMRRLREN